VLTRTVHLSTDTTLTVPSEPAALFAGGIQPFGYYHIGACVFHYYVKMVDAIRVNVVENEQAHAFVKHNRAYAAFYD